MIPPAYALAGPYNNPIPARFLAPLDCSKAEATLDSGIGSLEWIPGLLKRLQLWAQATLANRISSLESIPGLSLCRYLEMFKEPRNRFQGTRDAGNNRHT